MMKLKSLYSETIIPFFCEYETSKMVKIRFPCLRICKLILVALAFCFIIGFFIVYKKEWSGKEEGVSAVISKLKGVALTKDSEIMDVADYVVPPQENNAFFIKTNELITTKQTRGNCAEDESILGAKCNKDSDCVRYKPLENGVTTGKCLNQGICEIIAWCPVESSKSDIEAKRNPLFRNLNNFTVYIRNNIEFREFGVSRSNIPANFNSECRYDPKTDPTCPIFTIDKILELANIGYIDIAVSGGVIEFKINWECNVHYHFDQCFPIYSFKQFGKENGWNFRYANYYYNNNKQHRDVIKAYGIRILITVSSTARKLDLIGLITKVGSYFGLITGITVICGWFLTCSNKNHKRLPKAKPTSNSIEENEILS